MIFLRTINTMLKRRIVSALLLSLAMPFGGCSAQQRVPTDLSRPLASVSFELYHNRVYLPVDVDGRVITMVLDTGAADSGVSDSVAKDLGLKPHGTAQLVGNGESNQRVSLAQNIRFSVGDAELTEKSVVIVPFGSLEAREGRAIAGVLGLDLFRKYVVMIDYEQKRLSLFDSKHFIYQGSGVIVPLPLFQATMQMPGGQPISLRLAIDSGTYSALRLVPRFAQEHGLLVDSGSPSLASFGFGIGGEFPEKIARVADLQIGSLHIPSPLASISEATHGATASSHYDGTVGGAILSRFTVTLDYAHSQMILEPNAEFAAPFRADTSGLIFSASGSDFRTISILHVIPNTPGAGAGIQERDVLLSVDGASADSLGLERIRLLFERAGDFHLQIRRGSSDISVRLTTRDLVP